MKSVVTLKELCKQKKVDPKTARRKLRASRSAPKPVSDARWAWTPVKAKAAARIITA